MKQMVRIVCLVLSLLMLVAAFVACDDKSGGELEATTTTTTTTTTPPPGEELPSVVSNLGIIPASVDYDGAVFNVLFWPNARQQLWPETMVEGESIQNDLYLRCRMIEDELGIVVDPTFKASHMSGGADGEDLYNEALEGTTAYEAICSYSLYPPKMVLEGILTDLYSMEYPDTRMEWYPSDIDAWEIKNRLFFVANNSSVRNILANWVIYANRTMIENKGLENIEQVVIDGNWTLDTLKTYSRNWASEAESNAAKEEADRVYGFTASDRTVMMGFYHGAGFSVIKRDANGDPAYAYFDKTQIEQISNFLDKFLDICHSPEFGGGPTNGWTTNYNVPLSNENSVFHASAMDMYWMIDEDETFAIIPFPKLDEQQNRYYGVTNNAYDVWCVPNSATDSAIGGMLIEATSYNDYSEIAPKFFDMDFKYRYSSDENGVKIFDLIRQSYTADFGRIWIDIGTPYGALNNCYSARPETMLLQNTFANEIQGTKMTANTNMRNLKKLIESLYAE